MEPNGWRYSPVARQIARNSSSLRMLDRAFSFARFIPRTRRSKGIRAGGVPIHYTVDDPQCVISHRKSVLILYPVKQVDDFTAGNRIDWSSAKDGIDKPH